MLSVTILSQSLLFKGPAITTYPGWSCGDRLTRFKVIPL